MKSFETVSNAGNSAAAAAVAAMQNPTNSSAENDYAILFRGVSALRGLSTFVDPDAPLTEIAPSDLSDLVYNAQQHIQETNAPATSSAIATTSTTNRLEIPVIITNAQQKPGGDKLIYSEMNPVYYDNKDLEMTVATSLEPVVIAKPDSSSNMMMTRHRQNSANLKRLATSTNTSSLVSSSVHQTTTNPATTPTATPTRRGRKPNSMNGGGHLTPAKAKLIRKQIGVVESESDVESLSSEKTTVHFGNKEVVKDTDEYKKRRESNNVAVKKCREKQTAKQQERESRISNLEAENARLNKVVESQMKEIHLLKEVITRTMKHLPPEVERMLKSIDH